MQELLNREDGYLWGFVSNGLRLRILRDNKSLTRHAFVEFDLQAMIDGQVYSDFKLLLLLCHQSRVEGERPEFDKQDYYRQLLRLVYRLLFLFLADDRDVLLDPRSTTTARERYAHFYSTHRLRTLAGSIRGTHTLYQALHLIFSKLDQTRCPELGAGRPANATSVNFVVYCITATPYVVFARPFLTQSPAPGHQVVCGNSLKANGHLGRGNACDELARPRVSWSRWKRGCCSPYIPSLA